MPQVFTVQAVVSGCAPAQHYDLGLPARVAHYLQRHGGMDAAVVAYPQDGELGIVLQWKGTDSLAVYRDFIRTAEDALKIFLWSSHAYLGDVNVTKDPVLSSLRAPLSRLLGFYRRHRHAAVSSVWL